MACPASRAVLWFSAFCCCQLLLSSHCYSQPLLSATPKTKARMTHQRVELFIDGNITRSVSSLSRNALLFLIQGGRGSSLSLQVCRCFFFYIAVCKYIYILGGCTARGLLLCPGSCSCFVRCYADVRIYSTIILQPQ